MSSSEAVSPSLVYELINAHRKSKVLFAAVELGLFDILASTENGLNVQDIFKCVEVSQDDETNPSDAAAGDTNQLKIIRTMQSVGSSLAI
jgi:hypothetical protein